MMVTDKPLGPLGRYAEGLEAVDSAQVAELDRWFESTLDAATPMLAGIGAGIVAGKLSPKVGVLATQLGFVRRLLLIAALATPASIGVGVVVNEHRMPAPVALADTTAHSPVQDTFVPPRPWKLAFTAEQRNLAVAAVQPPPASAPDTTSLRRSPRRPGHADASTPIPPPLTPTQPRAKGDAHPSPEDLAKIERARDLAQQAGRAAETEVEYLEIIHQSRDPHIIEVAYRELVINLVLAGRRSVARRYFAEYVVRFPKSRYLSTLQLIVEPSQP